MGGAAAPFMGFLVPTLEISEISHGLLAWGRLCGLAGQSHALLF